MYSPTQGRFITQDPIGFDAGDNNLYRFVGNNPPNTTDPSGLAPPPPFPNRLGTICESVENEKAATSNVVARAAWGKLGGGRKWYMEGGSTKKIGFQLANPGVIPDANKAAAAGPGTNIPGGYHAFFGWPRNDVVKYFGTGGCEACVGLIIVCDRGVGAVFHFKAEDGVGETLGKYNWERAGKCKAYVFGGNKEAGSKGLFNEVLNYCHEKFGRERTFIVDSDHLLVGYDGHLWVRPPVRK